MMTVATYNHLCGYSQVVTAQAWTAEISRSVESTGFISVRRGQARWRFTGTNVLLINFIFQPPVQVDLILTTQNIEQREV